MWSLTAHIARLWLWLWLWLRLLNSLEFLKLNDRSNRFAGQFAAPFRIGRARQRFSPVNPHSILRFISVAIDCIFCSIPRPHQRSNAHHMLASILFLLSSRHPTLCITK
jgi:hypothetical protein